MCFARSGDWAPKKPDNDDAAHPSRRHMGKVMTSSIPPRAACYLGKVPKCDICLTDIQDSFVDGITRTGGLWATMCPACYQKEGRGIGQGLGQHYVRTGSGLFVKDAG